MSAVLAAVVALLFFAILCLVLGVVVFRDNSWVMAFFTSFGLYFSFLALSSALVFLSGQGVAYSSLLGTIVGAASFVLFVFVLLLFVGWFVFVFRRWRSGAKA